MNLTGQPIHQKADKVSARKETPRLRRTPLKAKPKPPEPYLQAVRTLPCCICEAFGGVQRSQTEAHHPIHDRHSSERVPHHEAIPLCACHHRTGEHGKLAIHRGKATWRAKYGSDRDFIAATQDKLAHMLPVRT